MLFHSNPIQLSKRTTHHDANTRYTYGWHRAEILAALVNGVFLLALSFSIFVDAMSRFAEKPGEWHTVFIWLKFDKIRSTDVVLIEPDSDIRMVFRGSLDVDNPKLVVIVGCIGLTSGLIGMFLFHGGYFVFLVFVA